MHASTLHSDRLRGLASGWWNPRTLELEGILGPIWPSLFISRMRNTVWLVQGHLMGEIRLETCVWSPLLPFFTLVRFCFLFFFKHVLFITLVLESRKNTVAVRQEHMKTLWGQEIQGQCQVQETPSSRTYYNNIYIKWEKPAWKSSSIWAACVGF